VAITRSFTTEYWMPERIHAPELRRNDIIISSTDLSGRITFANNVFYRFAEYEMGELVGKPHNIIRHPDMPKAAFKQLWETLQQDQIWQGYVKNRSRNGKVYWVKATVFPCFKAGEKFGYISVRSKPEREDIDRAIRIYRKLP